MKNLFCTERMRLSTREFKTPTQAFESDRGRIIFSAPLRRLQKKAQVFPLESNAAVRSRLTHSLEVAHIGRYIVTQIIDVATDHKTIKPEYKTLILENQLALVALVENACLLHDIGNPPFGHFGEAAIQDWFKLEGVEIAKSTCKLKKDDIYLTTKYLDFVHFDGNPQGLRVVTCLQGEDGASGLNLTFAQLGAYLKYVGSPTEINPEKHLYKKAGYFSTEAHVFNKIKKKLGLKKGVRFSLAYLMEAADDLAYCLSDIEDGIEKGVTQFDRFKEHILKALKGPLSQSDFSIVEALFQRGEKPYVTESVNFRTKIINSLVPEIAKRFVENIDQFFTGKPLNENFQLIDKEPALYHVLEATRSFVAKTIYQSPEAEHIELAGYSVVHGLLNQFGALLKLNQVEFECLLHDRKSAKKKGFDRELRLVQMLPRNAMLAYEASNKPNVTSEWHSRAHLIVDYISGMTDDFALSRYQLLSGIRVTA